MGVSLMNPLVPLICLTIVLVFQTWYYERRVDFYELELEDAVRHIQYLEKQTSLQ
jgi:hypothetical protein